MPTLRTIYGDAIADRVISLPVAYSGIDLEEYTGNADTRACVVGACNFFANDETISAPSLLMPHPSMAMRDREMTLGRSLTIEEEECIHEAIVAYDNAEPDELPALIAKLLG